MLIVDSILIGGLKFVLNRIVEAADAEMNDDSRMREELLAAQMKLELGEITEDEFAQIERAILDQLKIIELRKRAAVEEQREASGGAFAVESVEAEFDHRDDTKR